MKCFNNFYYYFYESVINHKNGSYPNLNISFSHIRAMYLHKHPVV